MSDQPQRRLFFALWPPDGARESLVQLTSSLLLPEQKPINSSDLHMTLAFLGGCSPDIEAQVIAGAGALRCHQFSFALTQVGYWAKPRVLWCGPNKAPDAQFTLVNQLDQLMLSSGLKPEARDYQPHVTLARKIPVWAEQDIEFSIPWKAHDFCLVHSFGIPQGVCYKVLQRWPLEPVGH